MGVTVTREEKLQAVLLENYQRAGKETGYWGRYFYRELRNNGGVKTVKGLLRPTRGRRIAPGFQALIDAGRTDLSVEAVALYPRFRVLFTDEERAEAQRRLDNVPGFAHRRDVRPEDVFPDEIGDDFEVSEGGSKRVTVNAYERNPAARKACIAKYGVRCVVCEMSFKEKYGSIGREFIHVHHKKPIALGRKEYRVRPTIDLVPVCPNCHAMLHTKNPPLGVEELRQILHDRQQTVDV